MTQYHKRGFQVRLFLTQNAMLRGESGPRPRIDKRWDQVELSLAGMKKSADDHDARFLVILLPRRDQVSGQFPAERYNQRLTAILDRHDIPYINVLNQLQNAYTKYGKSLFIPWDGHNSKSSQQHHCACCRNCCAWLV